MFAASGLLRDRNLWRGRLVLLQVVCSMSVSSTRNKNLCCWSTGSSVIASYFSPDAYLFVDFGVTTASNVLSRFICSISETFRAIRDPPKSFCDNRARFYNRNFNVYVMAWKWRCSATVAFNSSIVRFKIGKQTRSVPNRVDPSAVAVMK